MTKISSYKTNTVLREDEIVIGNTVALPTDGSPILIDSISTLEQGYKIKLEFGMGIIGSVSIIAGDLKASYDRATGGNITKISEHLSRDPTTNSDFYSAAVCKVYTQANISTQTIDIYAVGANGYALGIIVKHLTITRSY